MRLLAKIPLFFLLTPCLLQAQQPDTSGVKKQLEQAAYYLEAAQLDSARYFAEKSAAMLEWCEDLYPQALLEARHLAGHIAMEQGRFEQAAYHFKEAFRVAVNTDGKKGLVAAQAYNDLGLLVFNQRFLDSSLLYHQYAFQNRLRMLGPEDPKTADSHNNIANCYQVMGKPALALFHYEKVLAVRRRQNGTNDPAYASALNNAANALLSLRRIDQAVQYFREALAIRQAVYGNKHPKTAQSLQNLGNAYFEQGLMDQAGQMFQQALDMYKQLNTPSDPKVADVCENLGNVYQKQADYSTALGYYQKALEILRAAYPESHPKIALLYASLGDAYLSKGETAPSLAYFNKAQSSLLHLGAEHFPVLANVLDKTGIAYRQTDMLSKALEAHQQALAIRTQLWGENHPMLAGTYANLGNDYWEQKNYVQARHYYQKSLELQQLQPLATTDDLSSAWSNLGRCLLEEGQLSAASTCFEQALKVAVTARQKAICLRQLGSWAQQAGLYIQALDYFDAALRLVGYTRTKRYNADTEVLLVLYLKSSTLLKQYRKSSKREDLKKALEHFREAINLFGDLLDETTDNDTRRRLRFQYRGLFEEGIESALLSWDNDQHNTSYLSEAFSWCEQTKNLNLMSATIQAAYAGLPAGWKDTFSQLEQEKYRLLHKRSQLTQQNSSDKLLLQQTDHELLVWSRRRDSLLSLAESRFSEFAHHRAQLMPVNIGKLQKKLQPDEAVLSFFTSDKLLFVFFVNRDTILAVHQHIDKAFEQAIRRVGFALLGFPKADAGKKAQIDSLYTHHSRYLYETIWKPIAEAFPLPKELIIAPDGLLHILPFDALLYETPSKPGLFRSYPYLIRKHSISYVYSAAMYNATLDQHSRVTWRSFLGVAPDFDHDSRGLAILRYNKDEIKEIKPIVGGKNLAGQDATLANFLQWAPRYAVLHLATHGQADTTTGDQSFLAFAEIKDTLNNEKLDVFDLYGMELPAELVTLSACESGIGGYRPGEGTISVARGFAYAGVRSILTTLWSVNDANATQLMVKWYKRLRKGEPKATALQQTKLDYINNSTHEAAFPFYWASFTLVGDTGPMPWHLQSWWHIWAVFAFFAIGVGVMISFRKLFLRARSA